jgi:hypothetical protein
MDNWHPNIVYQMATDRHREKVARGEAAQRQAATLNAGPVRARLATALIALARRLDPALRTARQEETTLTPGIPANG